MAFTDTTPCIIGHRGAAGLAPENTVPSFARACALQVDAVELDVYCVEDELIVIHDDTLERTTSGRGAVMDQTLAHLRQLDAGDGAQIPTLGEVAAVLPVEVGLNIELKGPQTAAAVAEWTRGQARQIMVSSFNHAELRVFKDLARGDVLVAPLFHRWRDDCVMVAEQFETKFVNFNQRVLNEKRMDGLTASGLYVSAYTVNSLARARALTKMGAHGLFTDRPDRVSRSALAG